MTLIGTVLSKGWRVEASCDNRLVVHGVNSRAYLYPDVESEKAGPYRLLLDYSDAELAKSILEKIANDPTLTVDNDFGTVLSGDEFVTLCKTKGGWDWRQSPTK